MEECMKWCEENDCDLIVDMKGGGISASKIDWTPA